MATLLARQQNLKTLPNEPDRWVDEPTGDTYADRWKALTNNQERRDFLLASGLRFEISDRVEIDQDGVKARDVRRVFLHRVGEPAIGVGEAESGVVVSGPVEVGERGVVVVKAR